MQHLSMPELSPAEAQAQAAFESVQRKAAVLRAAAGKPTYQAALADWHETQRRWRKLFRELPTARVAGQ